MNSLEGAPGRRERYRVQRLFELCEGPTGVTSVGRMLEGPNSRRLVLLRRVSRNDLNGIELVAGVVEHLAHPAIAKVVALATEADSVFVASEHIDGVSLHELLTVAARSSTPVPPRAATRIIHDALIAADEVDALLGWKVLPRCVFPDTIWVAEYGATLLTEPGVADYIHRRDVEASRVPAGATLPRGPAAVRDAREGLDLLQRLLTADHSLPTATLPEAILALGASSRVWESCRALANALAALPKDLFGTEQDVTEVVQSLAGTTLEMRRYQVMPLGAIRDVGGNEDETACFSGSLPVPMGRSRPVDGAAATLGVSVSGERQREPSDAPATTGDADRAMDDDAATTVFRPSRIPMLAQITAHDDQVTSSAIRLRSAPGRTEPVDGFRPRAALRTVFWSLLAIALAAIVFLFIWR